MYGLENGSSIVWDLHTAVRVSILATSLLQVIMILYTRILLNLFALTFICDWFWQQQYISVRWATQSIAAARYHSWGTMFVLYLAIESTAA